MSKSLFRVIVLSLMAYTYFKLKIKQDAMPKLLLIKQETEEIEWFYSFF